MAGAEKRTAEAALGTHGGIPMRAHLVAQLLEAWADFQTAASPVTRAGALVALGDAFRYLTSWLEAHAAEAYTQGDDVQ